MMAGGHKKPNRLEGRLIELIDKTGLTYKYAGNWGFVEAGKCPDFLSTDARELLIELFESYCHTVKSKETVVERVEWFRSMVSRLWFYGRRKCVMSMK